MKLNSKLNIILSIIFYSIFNTFNSSSVFALPAFPGAEGFGAETIGGRGGKIFEVTNLNDSGAGSLRECVAASGARTCVFRVGGTITLSTSLTISNPFITIAGQTAPGGGITLKKSNGGDVFSPKTHDIVIRYITARPGPGGSNHASQIAANGSTDVYNIIFDHGSFSWGTDSVWETWYQVRDTTIQWSYVNEGLDCSTHSKGCHSKGLMIGGYKAGESSSAKGSFNVSVHHNLMAHNGERNPLIQFCGIGQVINNITYNPYWTFSHQENNCIDTAASNYVNWIGNYHKKGPDSTSSEGIKISGPSGVTKAYVKGNIGPSRPIDTLPESNIVDSETRNYIVTAPAPAPAVTTTTAQVAYDQILAEGGNSKGIDCNGNWFARRDSHDVRVANDVKNGTGKIIDNPSEVGGWANIAGGTGCTDTDHDGMPDAWEMAKMGSLTTATNTTDFDKDGYTDLEEYFNGTNPKGAGGVTPGVSPNITNQPGSALLNFNILLHGLGNGGDNVKAGSVGNLNPLRTSRQLTVEIMNANNQIVATKQGNISFNSSTGDFRGSVDAGNITSGLYTLRLKTPQYLRKQISGIMQIQTGQSNNVPQSTLITGDINNDNALSILDYNMLYDCFADLGQPRNCSDTNKKLMSDLTDDGKVNQFDYNLFLRELSVQSGQ